MKKLVYLFFVLTLFITANSWAQVSGYSFTSSSGTYTEISGGTQLGSGTSMDDNNYNANPIGFTFTYNGTAYTQFSVNANGFLALGATVVSSYTAISTGTSNNIISANNHDLQGNAGATLRYELSGTSPNQVLTVQWKDFRHYNATGDAYNFQIKLYETSNNVEIVYGSFTQNATSRTAQVGLRGSSSSDYNNRTTTSDWSATTAGGSNSATCTLSSTVYPASGLTFTWSPPTSPVFNITPTSKDFGWLLTGTNSAYQQFVISNAGAGTLTITSGNISIVGADASQFALVDSNSYPIGLTTGQTAKVYVRFSPTSAGSKSANLQVIDNTKATQTVPLSGNAYDPVSSFPWTESFESVTIPAFPVGWFKENGDWVTTNNANSTYDADARTGTQFLRESYSATDEYIWTIAFQLTGSTSYDFSFYWAGDNYSGWTGDVFYNTSQISTGATQLGTSFVTSGTTTTKTYIKVTSTFTPSVNGVYYFAIRVNATSVPWYLSFDDFELTLTPACPAPTALTATNITTTSADLGWTENGSATKWDIELGPFGFTPTGTPTANDVTSNPYSYGSLSSNTQYSFYVRADCGAKEDTSPWTGPYSFTTLCDPISSFPFTEGFEGTWLPSCWQNPSGLWFKGSEAHSGTGCAGITYTAHPSASLISPPIALPNGYQLKFWWKDDDISVKIAGYDTTYCEISTDGGSTWTLLEFLAAGSYMTNYVEVVKNLSTYGGNTILLRWRDVSYGSLSAYGTGVDDIVIEQIPSCPAPTSLTATNVTTNSADLGWTENGSATTWDIELGPFGFTPTGTPTQAGVTSNPYTYGSLSSATQYSFYVRADCGAKEETSSWAGPYSFTTLCDAVTSFSENFDGVTPPAFPVCWEKVGTSGYAYTQSTNPSSAPNCLYMYGSGVQTVVAMPLVSNAGTGTHQLRFKLRGNFTAGESIEIGYMTDRTNASSFVSVTSVTASTLTYIEHTVALGTAPGSATTIAFRHPGTLGYSVLIDDVVWEEIPPYVDAEVTAILSPNTTETLGSTVTPQVTVKNNSEQTKNVPVTVEIWTAESLSKSINYTQQLPVPLVSENAPANAKSLKDVEIIHHPTISTPLPTEATILSEGFEGGVVPPSGWSQAITNSSYTWKIQTLSFHSGTYSTDVEYDPALSPQDESLISPVIDLSSFAGKAIKLSFWWNTSYYWHVSPNNNVDVSVDVSSNGGSSWTKLWTEDSAGVFSNWTWYNKIIDLTTYAGQSNFKVRFRYLGVDGAQFILDDITLYSEFNPVMVYQQNTTVMGLGSGASSSPTFPNWTASPSGYYQVKAYTSLSTEDMNPGNDLMTKNFAVPAVLNLTALIQGFYDGSTMVPDTVVVELHNASSPYDKKDEAKVVLNSSGVASANFYGGENTSTNYYLAVIHRNSIETWSSSTPSFSGGTMSYNFTTAQSQAYNNNLKLKFGKWCIFGGEIANNDQYIDGDDVTAAFNAQGASGYVIQDVTGDDYVDGDDVTLAYNNQGVGVTNPIVGLAKGIKKQVETKKEVNQE